jgi:hypothetical protein
MQKPAFKADVDALLDAPTPANAQGGGNRHRNRHRGHNKPQE